MRGRWLNRWLIAAAGIVVTLTTAAVPLHAEPLAPASRMATAYELPILLVDADVVAPNLLHNPIGELIDSYAFSGDLSFETGFNADVGRLIDRFAGLDGLFYSNAALGQTYTSLASGGIYAGVRSRFGGFEFNFGQASTAPGYNRYLLDPHSASAALGGRMSLDRRYVNAFVAGMTWNFARWGGINFSASQTAEDGGVLGITNAAARAHTAAMGVSAHVSFGGGWVTTASYSEGLTQLALRPGASPQLTSVHTEAFGVAVAKHGLFNKSDSLGVAFAQPGTNLAHLPSADGGSDLQFFGRDKLLANMAKETDIELGYKTEFFGNSVALQANASYQMNYGGITGRDSVSLLSKAKIKF